MEQDQGVSQPTLGTGIGNADHEKGSEEVIATVESVVVAPSPAPGSGHGESGHMASPPPAMTLEPGAPPGQEELLMSREVAPTDEPAPESPRMVRWGWGWGAVSGALREVSAGVAKDVMELKESFQAAINVDSDEEGQSEYEEEEEESAEGGDEEPSGSAPPAEGDLPPPLPRPLLPKGDQGGLIFLRAAHEARLIPQFLKQPQWRCPIVHGCQLI